MLISTRSGFDYKYKASVAYSSISFLLCSFCNPRNFEMFTHCPSPHRATSSGYTGDLGSTVVSRNISVGQGFGVEFLLSFVVVLTYFSAMCPHKRSPGDNPAVVVGLAYLSTTLVGVSQIILTFHHRNFDFIFSNSRTSNIAFCKKFIL